MKSNTLVTIKEFKFKLSLGSIWWAKFKNILVLEGVDPQLALEIAYPELRWDSGGSLLPNVFFGYEYYIKDDIGWYRYVVSYELVGTTDEAR